MSYIIYQEKEDIAYAMLTKLVSLSHSRQDEVHIALSGGSTPKAIFELIAKSDKMIEIKWEKLHFWWCDERCVAFEDKESNFGEADRMLFQQVKIPRENLHPMQGDISPEQATLNYVQSIKKYVPKYNDIPQFDWIWLGMGEDGHTASLFVNGVSLSSDKWVEIAMHPTTKQYRVTLTLKIINYAKVIDFLVTGESKANMLKKVFDQENVSIAYPAKVVKPIEGKLVWHLDQPAANELE
ncbi:6-phosphogluconolactonase [Fastidiosibacter lacustris]|uniref:6-phosphogluconolactonase n=1 Tax=Fastidiosibacter lacustris TaxID=2056695 RepID=UPI000E34EF17|nr:6-phosphogluconolactonase [Fastidiosibacter lacustris]